MEESSQHDDNTDLLEKLELKKDDEMEPAKSSATPFVVGSDISEKVKEKSKKKKVKKPIATGKPVKGEDDISSKLSAAPFVSSDSDEPVANPERQQVEQPESAQENPQHNERVLREVATLRHAVEKTDAKVDALMAHLGVPQSNNTRNPSGQPPSDDIGRREQGQPSPRNEDEDN